MRDSRSLLAFIFTVSIISHCPIVSALNWQQQQQQQQTQQQLGQSHGNSNAEGSSSQLSQAYSRFFSWLHQAGSSSESVKKVTGVPGEPQALLLRTNVSSQYHQQQQEKEEKRAGDRKIKKRFTFAKKKEKNSQKDGKSGKLFGFLEIWGPSVGKSFSEHSTTDLARLIAVTRDQLDDPDRRTFEEELEGLGSQQERIDRISQVLKDLFGSDACDSDGGKRSGGAAGCTDEANKLDVRLKSFGIMARGLPLCLTHSKHALALFFAVPVDRPPSLEAPKDRLRPPFSKVESGHLDLQDEKDKVEICKEDPANQRRPAPSSAPQNCPSCPTCAEDKVEADVFHPDFPSDSNKRLAREGETWKEAFKRLKVQFDAVASEPPSSPCDDKVETDFVDPRDGTTKLATQGEPLKDAFNAPKATYQEEVEKCKVAEDFVDPRDGTTKLATQGQHLQEAYDRLKTELQNCGQNTASHQSEEGYMIPRRMQKLLYCGIRYWGYTTKSKGSLVNRALNKGTPLNFHIPEVRGNVEWTTANARANDEWPKYAAMLMALEKIAFDTEKQDEVDGWCANENTFQTGGAKGWTHSISKAEYVIHQLYAQPQEEFWDNQTAKDKLDEYFKKFMKGDGRRTQADVTNDAQENPMCRAYATAAAWGLEKTKCPSRKKTAADTLQLHSTGGAWKSNFEIVAGWSKGKPKRGS